MYPNLYYAFKDLLGVEWTALRFFNSFGFFVALAFLAAAYVLTHELRRKERLGLMFSSESRIVVGRPATISELALNFLLGFLLGYKILGLFFSKNTATADPQSFIFSADGHLPAGLALGILFAGVKYYEKNKHKLARPEERTIRIWPHDRVGDMVIMAAVFGFLGAKIFHNLENWNEFWKNPIAALLSFSGLTFYGGLICAGAAIIYYARKHKMGVRHLAEFYRSCAHAGLRSWKDRCQVSGDGDWGIINSAYISTSEGKVMPIDTARFSEALHQHSQVYMDQSGYTSESEIQYKHVPVPKWLPHWTVAYNFPHNVINEGTPIKGCEGEYCRQLPLPVFPTAFYETIFCFILTGLLFFLRNKFMVAGSIFAIYLFLNGFERFFIEKMRVNTQYDILGFHPTQAELISSFLMITGIVLFVIWNRKNRPKLKTSNV